jgi:hypothetical protein
MRSISISRPTTGSNLALLFADVGRLSLQHPVGVAAHLLARDSQVAEHLQGSAVTLAHQPQ